MHIFCDTGILYRYRYFTAHLTSVFSNESVVFMIV